MSLLEAKTGNDLTGSDEPTLTAEPTPTQEEIKKLKEIGFKCVIPRHKWDDITYNVGTLTCRVTQHIETVCARAKDGQTVLVDIEPDQEISDIVITDRSVDPPDVHTVNTAPLPRGKAIATAIHELFVTSSQQPDSPLRQAS